MLWLALALILAIPTWLGITPPGRDTAPRRFVGRCLLYGVVAGALMSGAVWVASPHVPTGSNLLYGAAMGAVAGAALGLVVGIPWMLIARVKPGKHEPPAV